MSVFLLFYRNTNTGREKFHKNDIEKTFPSHYILYRYLPHPRGRVVIIIVITGVGYSIIL